MQRILLQTAKIILISISLFLVSCGNSQIIESTFSSAITSEKVMITADFDKIKVSQNIELELTQGSEKSVEVIASDEARQILIMDVDNGELVLGLKNNSFLKSIGKVKILITTPNISSLMTSSSAEIKGMNNFRSANLAVTSSSGSEIDIAVQTDNLAVVCSSGSTIDLKGSTKNLTANSSSGSSIDAETLSSSTAEVTSSSGSSIEIGETKNLDARSSSGSSITYRGTPQITNQKATSGSSISKR